MNTNTMIVLAVFFKCLVAITAILCGGYLLLEGKDGWGWFLIVAAVTGGVTVNATKDKAEL